MGTFCTESVRDGSSQTLLIHPSFAFSFDHLVGAGNECRRQLEAERLGSLQVNDQLVFGWGALRPERSQYRFANDASPFWIMLLLVFGKLDNGTAAECGYSQDAVHRSN